MCRHCGNPRSRRPRGLCWTCYESDVIRGLYEPKNPNGYGPTGTYRLAEPTDALPGTEEKVRVMEDRAARGLALFHPDDAQA